ncbi:MAG: hypothetical protein ABI268_02750 [Rhodanobacter sp.]
MTGVRRDARATTIWFASHHVFHDHLFVRIKSVVVSRFLATFSLCAATRSQRGSMLNFNSSVNVYRGARALLYKGDVRSSVGPSRTLLLASRGATPTVRTNIHGDCALCA